VLLVLNELIIGGLLIFVARVTDVSLGTIRTLMIFKGERIYAALIGFVEVIVYIIALNQVVTTLDNPFNLIIYALGFAAGNYFGSFFEEKMAIGQITVNIITNNNNKLVASLREGGYGVTVVEAQGLEGSKQILFVTLKRRDLNHLFELVDENVNAKFINILDSRSTRGGHFRPGKRK